MQTTESLVRYNLTKLVVELGNANDRRLRLIGKTNESSLFHGCDESVKSLLLNSNLQNAGMVFICNTTRFKTRIGGGDKCLLVPVFLRGFEKSLRRIPLIHLPADAFSMSQTATAIAHTAKSSILRRTRKFVTLTFSVIERWTCLVEGINSWQVIFFLQFVLVSLMCLDRNVLPRFRRFQ